MPVPHDLRGGARMSVPPALAVEVPRAAVDRKLDESTARRLTVVTAGPGWGKTTAVAAWARTAQREGGDAVVWLTLTPADNSPAAFWGSLLRAVAQAGVVPEGHPLTFVSTAGGLNEEVMRALFRGLDSLPRPLLLIVDDFHVISDPGVMAALTDLVTRPTNVRVVLLTRFDPPLPLHRLRLDGSLAEVSAADLAFDAEAARLLASGAESLELTDAELRDVLARTEGWPTGVRLATMYLARQGSGEGLVGFGGTDKSVAEYLVAEVLQRHEPDVRDFLLRTSVVEWVTGDLADALVPGGRGQSLLESLEGANQFVVSVNADRTIFRYHPLLRDLLMHSLQRDDPAAFRDANRAASGWLLAHRHPVRALQYAVAAQDWQLAIDTFVEASPSVVGARRAEVVEHLRAIPFATLTPTAGLELCAAGLEFATGHFDGMASHVTCVRRLLAAGDQLSPVAMAFLENLSCAVARSQGDEDLIAETSAAALHHVSMAAPSPGADGNRTIAMTQSAVGMIRTGAVAAARERLLLVANDDSGADVDLAVLGARSHLAFCDLSDADLDGALAMARAIIDDATLRGWTSQMQIRLAYLSRAVALALRGDVEGADRALTAGLAATANGIEGWATIALSLAQASVAVARRRPRMASAALATACTAIGDRRVPQALDDTLTRVRAEVAIVSGELEGASLGVSERPTRATQWSTHARLALVRGDMDEARQAASRVSTIRDPHTLDDLLAAIEGAIVEGLVADASGRSADAARAMGRAIELAAPQRITRPFSIVEPVQVARVIQATHVPAPASATRESILATLGHGDEQAADTPEPDPLIEPLTERELAVLTELPTMRTNEEIATAFYVSVNTVKSHLKHTYRKLGVTNRRDAVRRARELGLLD